MSSTMNRRRLLGRAALGATGIALGPLTVSRAEAQAVADHRFVFAYFEGGWDILLGLDPRDPATTNPDIHRIDTGYGQLNADYQSRGVQVAGDLRFGPIVPDAFLAHASDLSIINGIGMDTAAHEVGRRYFITGRFPRGISAVGSSTPAEILAQMSDETPIPHLSAAVEAYANGLPSYASPLTINSVTDLGVALTPFSQIDPTVLAAVRAYQDEPAGCVAQALNRDDLSGSLRRNQVRARSYIESELDRVFDLARTDAEMVALRDRYGINDGDTARPDSPEVLAFVAAQALKNEVSQAVSVRVAEGLDTHANWADDQPGRQARGWAALAALISDLKASPLGTGSVWDRTTLVVFSEFGRTPLFNGLRGRDHFLGNSCLVAGPGLRRGVTIGASADVGMMPLFTDLASGTGVASPPDDDLSSGRTVTLSPKHVLTTVLTSVGLDPSYLRSAPITALLA